MREERKVWVNIDAKEVAKIIMDQVGMKSIEQSPLLQITLEDINCVPTVYYNGEEIKSKIRVSFDWKTRDHFDYNSPFIRVEYADVNKELGNFGSKAIQHNQPIEKEKQLNDYTTSELLDELGSRDGIDVIELQTDFNIDEFRNSDRKIN
ncbi:hypothetical protein ACUIJN_03995 [Metabacillus halosaccharovorans]|uniref:hypothetical protein n=1 Tax=Metabacillus halosaccharovorans TaxID=930124 RepID=UPI0037367DAD